MKLFRFDVGTADAIQQHGSQQAAVSPLLELSTSTSVVCIFLGTDGLLGGHDAVQDQLFIVVAGRGWVRTKDTQPTRIQSGQAAFWQAGEWHESGSHHGLMAIVIEGDGIDPEQVMQPLFL